MNTNRPQWTLVLNVAAALLLISGVAYLGYQFTGEDPSSGAQLVADTPANSQPELNISTTREAEAANLFATNAVKLTKMAPVGPTLTPDLRVFTFQQPQRVAGKGVILEGGRMGGGGLLSRSNQWVGYLNNTIMSVTAGEGYRITGAPSGEGQLLLTWYDPKSLDRVGSKLVSAPKGIGPLSIVDVQDTLVIMSQPGKDLVAFDMLGMDFVSLSQAAVDTARAVGDGTLRFEVSSAPTKDASSLTSYATVTDGLRVTVVSLTSEVNGSWSLAVGSGSSDTEALRSASAIKGGPTENTLRIFDIRGSEVFFVAGRRGFWVLNVDTGQWSNGDEAFAKQPDYVALTVPEYRAIMDKGVGGDSEPTATLTEPPIATGVPAYP